MAAFFIVAPAAQEPRFSTDVYPILAKAGCEGCHTPDGVASATRLHFPEPGSPPAVVDAFGESLRMLVDAADPDKSLLLRKPTNRIPHTGGVRIKPGTHEEATLRAWVEHLAQSAAPAAAPTAVVSAREPQILRRLTHAQYDNAVRDLVGDISRPARQFPPEDFVNGFKNQIEGQAVSPLLAEGYNTAAARLADEAFRGGDARRLLPCKADAPEAACAERFVREFGLRAFRRPLTGAEVERYTALVKRQKSLAEGARLALEAMLQSPNFLFRLESTPVAEWKPYARAARLSFLFWDTTPDASLLESARRGELDTADGLERTARRMLEDPRARTAVDEFVAQWLRLEEVPALLKERRSFPQYTRELALAMREETRRLAADLIWNDRSFMELYTADYTFLDADLAGIYKLPAPEAPFARVSYPADSERSGILGHASFFALTSKPAETSPTARGLFVREHFLCQKVPPPPPGVNTNLPPVTEDRPRTNRERLQVHLANESCASCHRLIDPIGLGLEHYDALGIRHDKYEVTILPERKATDQRAKKVELEIDTRGAIAGIPDSDFSSPRELGRVLAARPECQDCVVKQLFRYAMGRLERPEDRPVLEALAADFRRSKFRFKELMVSVVKWTEFAPGGAR